MKHRTNRTLTSLADRSGVAALELGLLAPVLLLLMLGGYDLTIWIRAAYRLSETAADMGEVVSQCASINTPADINVFDANAQTIAGGTDISSQSGGAFILSGVGYNANNALVVLWQTRMGNPSYGSKVGAPGGAATLGAYQVPTGEVLIATEVYSGVQPWVLSSHFLHAATLPPLYSSALFLARTAIAGGLSNLTPSASGALACAS
jgi:Flp pilus assembly protein TadG